MNGREYKGNRICFGIDQQGEDHIGFLPTTTNNTVVQIGEIGKGTTVIYPGARVPPRVKVYVNPLEPGESVLVPGILGGTHVFIFVGMGCFVLALVISLYHYKMRGVAEE